MPADRRSFIKKTALYSGSLYLAGCKTIGQSGKRDESFLRVSPINNDIPKRREWKSLSAEDKQAFIDAVKAMKGTEIPIPGEFGNSGPRKLDRWAAQAECHQWFCVHRTSAFLPWHRSYLYYFELYLRKQIRDSFRLPYWDWTLDQEIPKELQSSELVSALGITRKAINIAGPGSATDVASKEWWGQAFNECGKFADYDTIGGDLESSGTIESPYHNKVHTGVGGNMGKVPIAAADPVFWLHHCNIDRLWSYWMDQIINAGNLRLLFPSADVGAWLDTSFPNHFWKPDHTLASASVQSSLFTEDLGYNYDTMNKTWTLDDIPRDQKVAEVAADLSYADVESSATLRLADIPGSVLSLQFALPAVFSAGQRLSSLRIKLAGLQQPRDNALTYAVNLNLGGKTLPLPGIAFFAEAAHGAVGLSLNKYIDALRSLPPDALKAELTLTLQDSNNNPVSIRDAVPNFVADPAQYDVKVKAVFL